MVKKLDRNRTETLKTILSHERNKAFAQVREYRRDQDEDAAALPMDELDVARTLADVETHAGLIEQVENRIKQIDAAFSRLERGLYGICEECGDEIPLERLEALPFATRCVDCQRAQSGSRRGEGGMIEPFGRKWEVPTEVDESTDDPRDENSRQPEEELVVHRGAPLGPEEGELETPPRTAPGRRRRR
jgi:DnaK suppressor protein